MADTTPDDAKQVSKARIFLPMLLSMGISAYLIAFNAKTADAPKTDAPKVDAPKVAMG